jgi:dTDP-4-amino-4,6-dideoxygalactose transaminase
MNFKTIHIALSPNNTWRDTLAALGLLILPWNWFSWKKGPAVGQLEDIFREMTGGKYVSAVGSGREALLQILTGLELEPGSEIIVQSFTCMVVVNSILWAGYKPVYVDIDHHFNLSPDDLRSKITNRTKAVIIQHTFGIPGKIPEIQKICEEKGLILIEDCAHSLGATVGDRPVGSFGDLSFFSLGRSKVVSCVNGGVIVCNKEKYLKNLEQREADLKVARCGYIFQNLMHPLICSAAKCLYSVWLGKLLMVAAQKLRLINLEVTPAEKKSVRPRSFVSKLPNAMAKIALIQMGLLKNFNQHRRTASQFYHDHLKTGRRLNPASLPGAIFLRYPLLIKNPAKVRRAAKRQGVILGDWYSVPVAPPDVEVRKTGYQHGSCPVCEKDNAEIINLPTHHSLTSQDLNKIVNLVNQYAED